MPTDLTGYPAWQKLVETRPAYRRAWEAGTFPPSPGKYLVSPPRAFHKAPRHGPGTELKRLLARFWIRDHHGCECNHRAKTMNLKGCDWCQENIATIVGWMREEAKKRRLPFVKWAATILVRRAIRNARLNSPAGEELQRTEVK